MVAQPSTPRVLGRYALYSEIASGGMATVHLGRLLGEGGFSKTVAIKCLHPQFAKDPDFVAMFLDEARLAARIQHPNVVSTLDVVSLEGALFLVMELVQGESLSRLLRAARAAGKRIPPAVIVAIMVGALRGLHAAHEATGVGGAPLQIVHRDVSPQNILVGRDGQARVLDFGVAKAVGRSAETKDGVVKGKLPYMAPEQFSGQATRATDVYAASTVLWEALVGRRLFKGENEAETLKLVLHGTVDPPSQHAADVPAELDSIVLRALARDPLERFATAEEMARALEKAVPVATPSEVADAVAELALATLTERARLVADIESSSLKPSEADLPTELASITEPKISEVPAAPRRRNMVALGAGALATLGVVAVVAFQAGRPPAASSAAAARPPDPPPSVSQVPPPAMPVAVASSAPVVESSAAVAPVGSAAPTRPPAPRATPAPKPAPRAAPNCTPPFTVDAQGFRHYKRECE